MKKVFLFAALLISASGIGGCGRTSGIEGHMSVEDGQFSKWVVIQNYRLASDVEIVDARGVMVGDLIKANVVLASRTHGTLALQYKFVWFDRNGLEISPDSTPWQPVIIYGRDQKVLQGVGPSPAAKEFKVVLRERDE